MNHDKNFKIIQPNIVIVNAVAKIGEYINKELPYSLHINLSGYLTCSFRLTLVRADWITPFRSVPRSLIFFLFEVFFILK
jgi:hypothetical protein